MKKIFLCAAVFFPLFIYAADSFQEIRIKNISLKTEIADTPFKRQQGLMNRETLADNTGMLFIFKEEGRYSFWMKNMRFALDIIWINEQKKIVELSENIPPCQTDCPAFYPQEKAKYVLEVNTGFIKKNNIKVGDYLIISYPKISETRREINKAKSYSELIKLIN